MSSREDAIKVCTDDYLMRWHHKASRAGSAPEIAKILDAAHEAGLFVWADEHAGVVHDLAESLGAEQWRTLKLEAELADLKARQP